MVWQRYQNKCAALDRNFDDLAEHFLHKVYGGLKGQIRLAVLKKDLEKILPNRPLRILDVGCGLGQIGLSLVQSGHHCVFSDLSLAMLEKSQSDYRALVASGAIDAATKVHFLHTPYQTLKASLQAQAIEPTFDVILCHALLEWVETPQAVIETLQDLLADDGWLSLCFYNPAAPIYRNLMMGNFNHLLNPKPADKGSLTPNHPVDYETVKGWLGHFQIVHESGIRVFYDYTVHKRGGLANPQAVIEMELFYSERLPFRLLGRYLHVMAQKKLC